MRSIRSLFLVVLIASLVTAPAGGARAARRFTFYGAGWGHGVGLSQWGAYGLAQQGWSAEGILTHFYSGTRVGHAAHPPFKIRAGIVQGVQAVHLSATRGPVGVRVGSVHGPEAGRIGTGSTWTVFHRGGRFRLYDGRGRLVGGRSWGGVREPLFVRYAGSGSSVHVAEAGHTYGRGWIEIELYACGVCALRAIAVVSPERYLDGVAEVPSSWPMAAMEAQAIAARTYAFEKAARLGAHRPGCDCTVYASTADQVYAGWDKEAGPDGGRWLAAVRRTRAEVATYHGALIQAYFSSSSGGHTESNANVWGGAPLPYLHGVCDPGDFTSANPNRAWTASMTASAIAVRIRRATGRRIGSARRFTEVRRTPSGRIEAITVAGTRGSVRISGDTLASALGLRSPLVWIDHDRRVRAPLRRRYDHLGCGPGVPMAPVMHVAGGIRQRFARGALWRNAKRGRTFWVRGPVERLYVARGGSGGPLGMPRSDIERAPACRGCVRTLFEHGAIYTKPGAGVHAVYGRVFWAFYTHGGTTKLGFPTTGVRKGRRGVKSAWFERGAIRCSGPGRCRVVRR